MVRSWSDSMDPALFVSVGMYRCIPSLTSCGVCSFYINFRATAWWKNVRLRLGEARFVCAIRGKCRDGVTFRVLAHLGVLAKNSAYSWLKNTHEQMKSKFLVASPKFVLISCQNEQCHNVSETIKIEMIYIQENLAKDLMHVSLNRFHVIECTDKFVTYTSPACTKILQFGNWTVGGDTLRINQTAY